MISNRYISYLQCVFMTLFAVLVLLTSGFASAQEKLEVRAANKDNYSRLVFDWKSGAGYSVKKEDNTLIVSFKKAAQASIADVSNVKNIGTISVLSSEGEPLKVSVAIPAESKFRDFKIGNRVIVDVYNSAGEPSREKAAVTPKAETKEAIKEEDKVFPEEKIAEEPSPDDLDEVDGDKIAAEGAKIKTPLVITVSSTRNIGLAVFERAGYLWLVQDDPSLKIPPTISGPESEKLGQFEEIEIPSGKAYRMLKPEGTNFYGEGGGLLWRLVVTPNPRDKKPLRMETRDTKMVDGENRSIFWPLLTARKVLDLKDPLVGDDIKIITVGDTGQTIGPARELVEMKILPSMIGMALVSKIDNLDINISDGGVSLSSGLGLAVSPLSDTASLVLKDDIEKEDAAYDRIKNPRDMLKIYDFSRWEMGGGEVLVENRRVLMVAAANKHDNTRVEDLITMAKLNLANDRGPEALGLLRVAEKELPGIEDTPEFLAIRGAAATLSGKYDEAIEDLAKPSIQQYGEINYWKAAALAGLEDWQQADKVMPMKLEVLAEYPSKIKQPVALALAEVSLRAGNVNIAERLLTMIEPDFSKMSVNRQSAWKYLKGEMERQVGNPEVAMDNWGQLLTGKDDYYRAKAGLSVTRMQLERKKITPVKAIDRLEGLRYAWRGDELETLINFRLGQIYIDNKDYLKGLFVLRNAVGLSPNSKISEEVTDYMTDSFRKLFTDGTLDDVSPLDAVSIYDEFKELTPIGKEGDIFVQNLAERLVDVDLLGRASALLEDQMNYRVKGEDKAKVGIRLAAIRLLDDKPNEAITALNVAESTLKGFGGSPALSAEIKMFRARALSKLGEGNKALSLLKGLKNTEKLARLRADIAWNGGLWNDAANAFQDLISFEGISKTRPMEEYQENLVLNRAIALNLSGNRTALAKLREQYGDLMQQSEKVRIFEMVTRPRQLGLLEDRDSVMSLISEVDLFGGFLESYKSSN